MIPEVLQEEIGGKGLCITKKSCCYLSQCYTTKAARYIQEGRKKNRVSSGSVGMLVKLLILLLQNKKKVWKKFEGRDAKTDTKESLSGFFFLPVQI